MDIKYKILMSKDFLINHNINYIHIKNSHLHYPQEKYFHVKFQDCL